MYECKTTPGRAVRQLATKANGIVININKSTLTGLAEAIQLSAGSSGVDGHHGDGVFRIRGQLGEQDGGLLTSHLGLVGEGYVSFIALLFIIVTWKLRLIYLTPLWQY